MATIDIPPGGDPELWALVAPLLAAKTAQGLSFGTLGVRLRCHRTHVSRALSARILPDRDRLLRIARLLGVDEFTVGRQWDHVAASRRDHRARRAADTAAGAPPDRLASHDDLMGALQGLLDRHGISHRHLERLDPELRRSTVGALPPWPPAVPGVPYTPPAGRGIPRLAGRKAAGAAPPAA
jgi:transcriptional regulator with XRE-family HTH domain